MVNILVNYEHRSELDQEMDEGSVTEKHASKLTSYRHNYVEWSVC